MTATRFSKTFGNVSISIQKYENNILDISIVSDGNGFQNITTISAGSDVFALERLGKWLIEIANIVSTTSQE